ncbi:MAG: type II toxin-antitoxin system VapC family toxin [Abditibacteriales bacterium]|nr:type II toxin-antitoxin system VapC family toxin [Abditibacteriales bacterium]MDW8367829.1 PIN domain-containing protein [Abditibacteriales bacterium]
MPALIHSFTDRPLPTEILLETSFVVSLTNPADPFHAACVQFVADLEAAGATVVYSILLRPELGDAVLKVELRAKFGRRWSQELGRHPALAGAFHAEQRTADEAFLNHLPRFTGYLDVPLLPDILTLALALIQQHSLRSYDAVHLATAQYLSIPHLATFDHHFDPIDGFTLWRL